MNNMTRSLSNLELMINKYECNYICLIKHSTLHDKSCFSLILSMLGKMNKHTFAL